jgi:hypothetical protein
MSRVQPLAAAVTILPDEVDNKAQEADAAARLAAARGWTRLIVVSDCASTRRAGFAFRRALGPRVTVIARCSRYDPFSPFRWWARRATFRETFYEAPKLLAYRLGFKG